MPIYETDETTRDDLDKLRRRNKCKECGGRLSVFYDLNEHKAYLACNDYNRTKHEGIEREASRWEKEGMDSLVLERRKEIMEQSIGVDKTRALSKYMGGVAMTKAIATEIVETMYGDAPMVEKAKVILLCEAYQLNPLMKHLHLIGYKRGDGRGGHLKDPQGNFLMDWSIQMGIGATRLLAQRKHNFSYLDMTPRRATKAEIEKVFGDEADTNSLYAFVYIKDVDTGAESTALRGIPKNYNVKGTDKGNTLLNQVCIWTERLALDRQYPGEMPTGVEVFDERYIDAEYTVADDADPPTQIGERQVNTTTGEIQESAATTVTDPEPEAHWCEEHGCAYELKTSTYGQFYAHKVGKVWCNEKKKKATTAKQEPERTPQPSPEAVEQTTRPERDLAGITTLNSLFKACNEDFGMQPNDVVKELGYSSQMDITDTPKECYLRIAEAKCQKPE